VSVTPPSPLSVSQVLATITQPLEVPEVARHGSFALSETALNAWPGICAVRKSKIGMKFCLPAGHLRFPVFWATRARLLKQSGQRRRVL
jgi:hypothetical protein